MSHSGLPTLDTLQNNKQVNFDFAVKGTFFTITYRILDLSIVKSSPKFIISKQNNFNFFEIYC